MQVPESTLQKHFPQSFVYLKPKDIVSGDFFWFAELSDSQYLIVAADCTGHGVPGAFMSMIGQMLLKEAVMMYGIKKPNELLEAIDGMLKSNLRQDEKSSRDGMDVSMCLLDKEKNKLYFAGAKNPLFIVFADGNSQLVKGDRRPIGGNRKHYLGQEFTLHTFDLTAGCTYYLYSDGFQDQFGGKDGKKMTGKRFRAILEELSNFDLTQQSERLNAYFEEWQGHENQIDDILVVGFKA